MRKLTKEIVVDGVTLAKGCLVAIPLTNNRHKNCYENATEFRPERFDTEVPKLERHEFTPFYEGKRKCIGYNMAIMNMKLMIGFVIDRYETKIADDFEMVMEIDAVYNVKNPNV